MGEGSCFRPRVDVSWACFFLTCLLQRRASRVCSVYSVAALSQAKRHMQPG
ncbi:hypothetical protein AG1IA_09198 [Rhizoctonia solani AG-1 IA]|uniref:Uncharacterized protein n=1 Tax=Thanatephorus cucumeris (strain AG1-IA) TaxID=983506 RepID=L8WJ01_THACA|nr:hypothetical protein AG1IA_09198 [Rhizoctonia solani AG-1 IA]